MSSFIQNIQGTSRNQQLKTDNNKMGKGHKQTIFQRRYTNGQQEYEKMLNTTNNQRNINQNKEIATQTIRMATIKKVGHEC